MHGKNPGDGKRLSLKLDEESGKGKAGGGRSPADRPSLALDQEPGPVKAAGGVAAAHPKQGARPAWAGPIQLVMDEAAREGAASAVVPRAAAAVKLKALTVDQAAAFVAGTFSELQMLGLDEERVRAESPGREELKERLRVRSSIIGNQIDRDQPFRNFEKSTPRFRERLAELQAVIEREDDPAGWLVARDREVRRQRHREAIWPIVVSYCIDEVLEPFEYERLVDDAGRFNLEKEDVDELIQRYDDELFKTKQKRLERVSRDLTRAAVEWPPLFGFGDPVTGMEELHDKAVSSPGEARKLLDDKEISKWLKQVEYVLEKQGAGEDVLESVRSAGREAVSAEARRGSDDALWRFLWKTGYVKLHFQGREISRISELVELCQGKAEKLASLISTDMLADWCQIVHKDKSLADAAKAAGAKGPEVAARDWLWLAGEDRLTLEGRGPFTNPSEVARFAAAAAGNIDILRRCQADGTLAAWAGAQEKRGRIPSSYREALERVAAETETAGENMGGLDAFEVAFLWGLDRLPLFDENGAPAEHAASLEDIRKARAEAPRQLEAAVESGAFAAWAAVHHDFTEDRVRQWQGWIFMRSRDCWPDAICWLLGDMSLLVDGRELRSFEDVVNLYEQGSDLPDRAFRSGALAVWLELILGSEQVTRAQKESSNRERPDDLLVFLWTLGYKDLMLEDGVAVSSPSELLVHADRHIGRVSSLLQSGLFTAWLKGQWPDLAERVQAVLDDHRKRMCTFDPVQIVLQEIGAEKPSVSAGRARIDFGPIREGTRRQATIPVRVSGSRGSVYLWAAPGGGSEGYPHIEVSGIAPGPSGEYGPFPVETEITVTLRVEASTEQRSGAGELVFVSTVGTLTVPYAFRPRPNITGFLLHAAVPLAIGVAAFAILRLLLGIFDEMLYPPGYGMTDIKSIGSAHKFLLGFLPWTAAAIAIIVGGYNFLKDSHLRNQGTGVLAVFVVVSFYWMCKLAGMLLAFIVTSIDSYGFLIFGPGELGTRIAGWSIAGGIAGLMFGVLEGSRTVLRRPWLGWIVAVVWIGGLVVYLFYLRS